ncbi:MAG: tetratricopeptide repeat protein [Defluviitaleaceae bacterium]|nr:tetratricopeptide repeat protein [Defluviitaleaceae bacterium]
MNDYNDMYFIMVESNNLGIHFCRQGSYQMALMFHLQALKIAETIMGKLSADYSDSLYNLGNTLADAGNYDAALKYLLAAEQHAVLRGATDDMSMVHLLNSLAYVMESMGDHSGAIAHLEAALGKQRKLAGSDNRLNEDVMRGTYYLAGVCERAGDLKRALAFYYDARRWIKQQGIRYYPTCLNNIANILTALGEVEKSLEPRLEAMEQIKETVGAGSISYAQSLRNLAVVYQSLGNYDRAKELLLSAIEIKRAILGTHSKEFIREIMFLIELYTKAGQSDKALEIFVRLLDEIGADQSGGDDAIREFANLYMDFGDINQLNELYSKAMDRYTDTSDEFDDKNV